MRRRLAADAAPEPEEGGGAPGGSHTFAVSMSHDGGEHWGPITQQPQLVTPVRRHTHVLCWFRLRRCRALRNQPAVLGRRSARRRSSATRARRIPRLRCTSATPTPPPPGRTEPSSRATVRPPPWRPSGKLRLDRLQLESDLLRLGLHTACKQTPARASRGRSTWAFRAHSATLGWRAGWSGRRMGRTARWPTRPALLCASNGSRARTSSNVGTV